MINQSDTTPKEFRPGCSLLKVGDIPVGAVVEEHRGRVTIFHIELPNGSLYCNQKIKVTSSKARPKKVCTLCFRAVKGANAGLEASLILEQMQPTA